MKYFAINLKDIRLENGLDQETLASASGLSVRTIQRMESGTSCSLESVKSVSAALNLKHYSMLLPQKEKGQNTYKPSIFDVASACFQVLVLNNAKRFIIYSMAIIGIMASMAAFALYDHMKPRTYDERYQNMVEYRETLDKLKNIKPKNNHVAVENVNDKLKQLSTENGLHQAVLDEIEASKSITIDDKISDVLYKIIANVLVTTFILSSLLSLVELPNNYRLQTFFKAFNI